MRFPRHARIFKGQLDAAPFAGVFFLALIFITFSSHLVFTPGVRITLPEAEALSGTSNPTISVWVTPSGQYYFRNQLTSETELRRQLELAANRAKSHGAQLTLVVLADRQTPNDVTFRLGEIARESGIRELLQATKSPTPAAAIPAKP